MNESIKFVPVNIAVLTVSDTRVLETDKSGDILVERIKAANHKLTNREIVKDDKNEIKKILAEWIQVENIDVIITTGGTGLTGRDITPEALKGIADKEIPGFGELFRAVSFEEIGTSSLQSRSLAGVANGTYIFCLPGSTNACATGWDTLIAKQLDHRTLPCNLVELMPRLNE